MKVSAQSLTAGLAIGLWPIRKWALGVALAGLISPPAANAGDAGSVLPFPPMPSASVAEPRLQDSKHERRAEQSHLPKNAPNILIILLDDVGFGLADTYGGPIHTPTLSRIAGQGLSYNAFHTTAICSPTRAALLTGRNHQRVGSGTIAERAVDWDGYTGVIPRSSATHRQGSWRLRLQDFGLRQVAQYASNRNDGDGTRLRSGPQARGSASITSTGFSPVRHHSGSQGWSRTSIRSSRPMTRNTI